MNAQKLIRSVAGAAIAVALLLPSAVFAGGPDATPAEIQAALDAAYAKYKDIQEGANADYIPALAKVDSKIYGIALVTKDGKVYTAGDVKSQVSIQSISKVFTMAEVMEESGTDTILNTIGADATGMRFNSIVSIEFSQKALGGPEMNPLVNPGAITATSMVKGKSRDEIWKKVLGWHSDFAGRPLTVDKEVFDSEAATNQRNQAIGYLMLAYGYIKEEPMRATDIYTEQCSIAVNAKDLATMAGDARLRRQEPGDRQAGDEVGQRPRGAGSDGDRRPLRRLRQVALQDRPAGQERRRRRSHRRFAGQVRHRGRLAAARRGGQQRARAEGDRGHLERARRQPVRREVGPGLPPPRAQAGGGGAAPHSAVAKQKAAGRDAARRVWQKRRIP